MGIKLTAEQRRQKKQEIEARIEKDRENQRGVRQALLDNKCPACGQGVVRNSSLKGWVQCCGLGSEGFRARGSKPCSWQGFF